MIARLTQGDIDNGSGVINLPAGSVTAIEHTIDTRNRSGLRIHGEGGLPPLTEIPITNDGQLRMPFKNSGAVLVWNGPLDQPMFRMSGVGSIIERVALWAGSGCETAIQQYQTPGLGSGKHTLEHVAIAGFKYGVQLGESITDHNCDLPRFLNVYFNNCGSGIRTNNHQSVDGVAVALQFINCDTCFDFQAGGSFYAMSVAVAHCGTVLALNDQAANNCDIKIDGLSIDGRMRDGWKLVTDQHPERFRNIILTGNISFKQRKPLGQYVNDTRTLNNIDGSGLIGWR